MAGLGVSGARLGQFLLIGGLLAAAGCKTADPTNVLDVGQGLQQTAAADTRPAAEDLRRFCPRVLLREGTAYFNTYEKGADNDKDRIVYQAAIAEVTRSCAYSDGQIVMTVAARGRIVPGPKGRVGQITMPIRIAAVDGQGVAYSQLFRHPVDVADTSAATQFVFSQPGVAVPDTGDSSMKVYIGYDEGPYNTP